MTACGRVSPAWRHLNHGNLPYRVLGGYIGTTFRLLMCASHATLTTFGIGCFEQDKNALRGSVVGKGREDNASKQGNEQDKSDAADIIGQNPYWL